MKEAPYAWVVVWATFFALAIIFGVSYSFAAFFASFAGEFNAQRADVSLVFGLSGSAAARCPLAGQPALLTDPALVLEPELEPLAAGLLADGGRDQVGQFFLNSACASGADLGCWGRAEIRVKPSAVTSLPMPRSW